MARRRLVLASLVLVLVVVGLERIGSNMLETDRREMYRGYGEDRLHRLESAALDLGNDVEKIGEDLELAAALLASTGSPEGFERELRAIAAITREYAAIDVRRSDGASLARVVAADAPSPTVLSDAAAAIDKVIAAAAAAPGSMKTSRPLGAGDEALAWLRAFARMSPEHGGVVVAIVVDMRPILARLRLLADESSALLVIGAHGSPAPTSHVALAEAVRTLPENGAELPRLGELMEAIEARRAATVLLGEHEARRVGLQPAVAVAVAVPVVIEDGEPWALALVSSTAVLASQERRLVRRVWLGGGFAIALLVALSAYFIRNARRAATLQERLRQADRVALLTERLVHSEKLATAGQLAAGIAHEIGTPLNIARGRAELAASKLGDDPQGAAQRIIVDQIDHVSRLIHQLLDYVRPRTPAIETVDAGVALRATSELLAAEAAKRDVEVTCEVAPGTPALRADPGQLRQVLVNLAMNALDACARGGHVAIRARPASDGAVELEVEDDGVGIPAAHRAQVFDPFFTTKKRGQGTGLGLWVVAQLVRSHGAEIDLASEPGGGTTIRITWPATVPTQAAS